MRTTWDQTWMAVAFDVAKRSACTRRQAGCVIVDENNRILSTGYNGPPANFKDKLTLLKRWEDVSDTCYDYCPRSREIGNPLSYDNCVALHAEANCLAHTDPLRAAGGAAYITSCPCLNCAKILSGAKISLAMFHVTKNDIGRHPELSINFLASCGVQPIIVTALKEFQDSIGHVGVQKWI